MGRLDTADALWRYHHVVAVRYHRATIWHGRNIVSTSRLQPGPWSGKCRFEGMAGYRYRRWPAVCADLIERIAVRACRSCGRLDSRHDAAVGGVAGDVLSEGKDYRRTQTGADAHPRWHPHFHRRRANRFRQRQLARAPVFYCGSDVLGEFHGGNAFGGTSWIHATARSSSGVGCLCNNLSTLVRAVSATPDHGCTHRQIGRAHV